MLLSRGVIPEKLRNCFRKVEEFFQKMSCQISQTESLENTLKSRGRLTFWQIRVHLGFRGGLWLQFGTIVEQSEPRVK